MDLIEVELAEPGDLFGVVEVIEEDDDVFKVFV
jgi:hypothetical protein